MKSLSNWMTNCGFLFLPFLKGAEKSSKIGCYLTEL